METIDEEFLAATTDFIDRAKKASKPFFVWFNTTRMHNFTHVRKENRKTELGEYADGMIEHDAQIGQLLDHLDKAGLTDNTIVLYTTDNGPMVCLWPDAGATPFRGEKNTNWEGGWRVPAMIRWPGVVKPGTVITDIVAGEDWLPTLLSGGRAPGIKEKLLAGYKAGSTTYKVHLDGYDQRDLLAGKGPGSAQGVLLFQRRRRSAGRPLRAAQDPLHGAERHRHGRVAQAVRDVARRRSSSTSRSDPTERGQEGMGYNDWWYRHAFIAVPAQQIVGSFLASFKEFPPRQRPGSFTIDKALEALSKASGAALIGRKETRYMVRSRTHRPAGVRRGRCDRSVRAGRQPVSRTSSSSSPMTSATPTSAIAAARSIRPTSTRSRTAACGWSRSTASPSAPRHAPH